MATLNTEASESNGKKKPTHFVNLSIVRSDGSKARVGAIPLFADGDKVQRTLIDLFEKGAKIESIDTVMDIRANVKSTEIEDADAAWSTRTGIPVTQNTDADLVGEAQH